MLGYDISIKPGIGDWLVRARARHAEPCFRWPCLLPLALAAGTGTGRGLLRWLASAAAAPPQAIANRMLYLIGVAPLHGRARPLHAVARSGPRAALGPLPAAHSSCRTAPGTLAMQSDVHLTCCDGSVGRFSRQKAQDELWESAAT